MKATFEELVEIMDRLRGEGGCSWDREQTLESVFACMQAELREIGEAIAGCDPTNLCEELGDLLFVLVFATRIGKENSWFDMKDVLVGIRDKIVRRHPHVFGEPTDLSPREALDQWNRIKAAEKNGEYRTGNKNQE